MKNKSLRSEVIRILLGFFFIAGCLYVVPGKVLAGGGESELTGNRGYLVGGPKEEGVKPEKKVKVKRQKGKLEPLTAGAEDLQKHITSSKETRTDAVVPAKKGDIGPKGYLVGTPKGKAVAAEKERGRGGFSVGLNKAMEDLKEFNRQIKNRPYPADQNLEGQKGGYIYGEPPAEEPEPQKEIARTRGLEPLEAVSAIGKGFENLHKTWNIKPHRSVDKEIWGFRFPDMPKEEKKGITKRKGNPIKTFGGFIDAVGADIEKRKAAAPLDK